MYIFNVTDSTGAVSGYPSVRVYDNKGRLKTIGGGSPPPPAPVVWGTITGLVTNQTDLITYLSGNYYPLSSNPAGYLTQTAADLLYYPLSSNPAGYITAAALTGYVPTTRTLTINGTSYDLSADRSWTIPAGGTVTDVTGTGTVSGITLTGTGTTSVTLTLGGTLTLTSSDITTALGYTPYNATNPAGYITLTSLSAGTGITYNNLTGVITNSAPDQVVSLSTTGTGLAVTGTYPSFTLQNTLPDQTVVLTAGTGISITGTYPSFTIDNTSTGGGGIPFAVASGTDTYTATVTGVTAYADGDAYIIRFTNGNTDASTLNINGLGAIPLHQNNQVPLIGGDIWAGGEMLCIYNSADNSFECIGTSPNSLFAYVTNDQGSTITKGQAVYAFSGTGNRMTVKLARADSDATSAQTIGVVYSTSIAANQKGIIIIQGYLTGLNLFPTATWSDGDPIYLSPTTAGAFTKTKPYAPNHLVYCGILATASNGNAGRMYVRVQNGYELDELHNVQAQSPSLNDTLWYDNTVSPAQWKTASIATILGYTPANINSPAFTGIPTAPTAASGTNTTQIATTAFVQTAVEQSSSLVGIFGDGGSGNATITGSISLTNDAYYNDLTISGAGSIFLNGFRLFVKGTLDISNAGALAIYNNGFAGDDAVSVGAGNNTASGTLGRGGYGVTTSGWHSGATGSNVPYRGGNGGAGASANTNNAAAGLQSPASTQAVAGGFGGSGGKGGNSAVGSGALGGAGQTTSASPSVIYARTFVPDLGRIQTIRQSTAATTTTTTSSAGAYHGGGGGGAASSTASLAGGGGAGGGGGGNTIVYARQIIVGAGTNAEAIASRGGRGGNVTYTPAANVAGAGGAGGGGGGYIYLVYGTITGGSYTFASANGGVGGNGGNGNGTGLGGQGGTGGSGGRITAISLGYNTITVVDGTTNLGTTPAIPVTTTGSAGGAGGTCTFSS